MRIFDEWDGFDIMGAVVVIAFIAFLSILFFSACRESAEEKAHHDAFTSEWVGSGHWAYVVTETATSRRWLASSKGGIVEIPNQQPETK